LFLLFDKEVIIPTESPGIAVSIIQCGGMPWCSWLRHYNTSQKVVGLIPDGVIRISHLLNPSSRTLALGVDSATNRHEYEECFLGGKGGRCIGLTTYHVHVPIVWKSGKPQGIQGLLYLCQSVFLWHLLHTFLI
jgi:hypothetical protein